VYREGSRCHPPRPRVRACAVAVGRLTGTVLRRGGGLGRVAVERAYAARALEAEEQVRVEQRRRLAAEQAARESMAALATAEATVRQQMVAIIEQEAVSSRRIGRLASSAGRAQREGGGRAPSNGRQRRAPSAPWAGSPGVRRRPGSPRAMAPAMMSPPLTKYSQDMVSEDWGNSNSLGGPAYAGAGQDGVQEEQPRWVLRSLPWK
jgi:hypothetical protein